MSVVGILEEGATFENLVLTKMYWLHVEAIS